MVKTDQSSGTDKKTATADQNAAAVFFGAAAFLGFLAYACFEALVLRRGFPAWDQITVLSQLQRAGEGLSLPLRATGGILYFYALHSSVTLLGKGPAGLYAVNALLMALECALLFRRASRSFGAAAGLGAVLADLLSTSSVFRFRSLLTLTALPCELLLLLEAIESAPGPLGSLALGSCISLMAAEYEGWAAAYPVLALFWWRSDPSRRPRGRWLLCGILMGAALVLWESRGEFENYLARRLRPQLAAGASAPLMTFWAHLKAYALGGSSDLYLGSFAAVAPWTWPLLALGALRAWRHGERSWLAWPAIALWPLATSSLQPEAHRCVAAWPALCLLAGAGFASAAESLRPRPRLRLALLGSMLAWGALTALACRVEACADPKPYGYWEALDQGAAFLRQRARLRPLKVLSELNHRSVGEARFLFPEGSPQAAECWALIPAPYAPHPLDPSWGDWLKFGGEGLDASILLLRPVPGGLAAFEARHAFLLGLWQRLPDTDSPGHRRAMQALLSSPGFDDPWLRRACLDHYLKMSMELRAPLRELVAPVLAEKNPSAFALAIAAASLERADPKAALSLARRSLALDPSVSATRELAARLETH